MAVYDWTVDTTWSWELLPGPMVHTTILPFHQPFVGVVLQQEYYNGQCEAPDTSQFGLDCQMVNTLEFSSQEKCLKSKGKSRKY